MRRIRLKVGKLMAERGMSANSVAQAIGVSHNTVLAYANNTVQRPDLGVLMKLLDHFGCKNLTDLMDLEGGENSSSELTRRVAQLPLNVLQANRT